jgi:hypothetical protein
MTKTTARLARATLTVAIAFGSASHVYAGYPGTTCVPQLPGDAAKIQYTQWGVQNNDTSSRAFIECGAAGDSAQGSFVSLVEVMVYDRNPSDDVCCTFLYQLFDGTLSASVDKCSSGTSQSATRLSHSFPSGSRPAAAYVNVQCRIPAQTSTGLSHMTAVNVVRFTTR